MKKEIYIDNNCSEPVLLRLKIRLKRIEFRSICEDGVPFSDRQYST
jgi:hypothetical protein